MVNGNEVYGPYGSNMAVNWNMKLQSPTLSTKKVSIRSYYIVHSLELQVVQNSQIFGYGYGGSGGTYSEIVMKQGERITQISGTYGQSYLSSLTIHTNFNPNGYGPIGMPNSIANPAYFEIPIPLDDGSTVELFGSYDNICLRSIGASITKVPNKLDYNMEEKKGSIAFFSTYRPPVALDIYSAKYPPMSVYDEKMMTDGKSYNYNGRVIPSYQLKLILQRPLLQAHGTHYDVDSGRLSGLIFVSERTNNLETLHIALLSQYQQAKVFNFAEVYNTFKGVRLEDSGCFAGDYLVYVSTMQPAIKAHQSWTAVYKTHLVTGATQRITPIGEADLSPSVSPDGRRIAVASFDSNVGWDGAVEDLKTNILIVNVDQPTIRQLAVVDGGWPTWGSDDFLFFHRNTEKVKVDKQWGVFRVDVRVGPTSVIRVTPMGINAMTPVALNMNQVIVATLRRKFTFEGQNNRDEDQYRHIEVFDVTWPSNQRIEITRKIRPKADHFNPFLVFDNYGGLRIGYHRCNTDKVNAYNVIEKDFHKLQSPDSDIGVFRVSGVFPSISECGKKLAFVDNEFKAVWIADDRGLHIVFMMNESNRVFSPVWNRKKDILYVCVGPSFSTKETVQILAIMNVSSQYGRTFKYLTKAGFNCAFPSTNKEGTRLVYRSTFSGEKNLYIMENADLGEFGGRITRLTQGDFTDTHCQWSPNQDWIVFSSNRANPKAKGAEDLPDPGFFAIYLVNANNANVVVKVIDSGLNYFGGLFPGHVSHPFFSPDGKQLVVSADFAGVSCDPISLPLFVHSVRPYGDLFLIDIDTYNIYNNQNVTKYTRVTHSKYENSTATWTNCSTTNLDAKWLVRIEGSGFDKGYTPSCPFRYGSGVESVHMTGHLCFKGERGC